MRLGRRRAGPSSAEADIARDREAFDPSRSWQRVEQLLDAAKHHDADAFAAAVSALGSGSIELDRNSQRLAVALILTVMEVAGSPPPRDQLTALAADLEAPLRSFARVNRWDLEEVLEWIFVKGPAGYDFTRAAIIGSAIVGELLGRDPSTTAFALPDRHSFLETKRGAALRLVANYLAERAPSHLPPAGAHPRKGTGKPSDMPADENDMPTLP